MGVAAITPFGKCIKRRLLDIDKDQNWLIDQVAQKTNLYFDRSYLHKIMTGRLTTPGIKQAICEILDICDSDMTTEYVQYNCPCGCGSVVMLPTKKHSAGYDGWGFSEENGKVTLSPSVFSSGFQCKSHYFIRNNAVNWC